MRQVLYNVTFASGVVHLAKILVVEDDEIISAVVEKVLTDEKYVVDAVATAADGLAYLDAVKYDLVILDWGLPDATGLEVCQTFREKGGAAPVLFLTGHALVDEKVQGLDAGADDYLTKPFNPKELLSRVRAILRRPPVVRANTVVVRDLELNSTEHIITKGGAELKLFPKEYTLLELFILHPRQVFSVDDLLDRVWKTDSEASVETVRMTILRLRQKVETEGEKPIIQTVRGAGYRLEP